MKQERAKLLTNIKQIGLDEKPLSRFAVTRIYTFIFQKKQF